MSNFCHNQCQGFEGPLAARSYPNSPLSAARRAGGLGGWWFGNLLFYCLHLLILHRSGNNIKFT